MRRYLLVALLAISWIPQAGAQKLLVREVYDPKTKTQIEVKSLFGILPQHGYVPIRATIHNGTKEARTWSFAFEGKTEANYSSEGTTMTSSFSVTVQAGGGGFYDFSVPLPTSLQSSSYGSDMQLSCTVSATGLNSVSGGFSDGIPDGPQVLLSEQLEIPNGSALNSKMGSSRGSGQTFAGVFRAVELPQDWRAFLGYDVMMLTEDEWLSIEPGARNAIMAWNRMGGQIIIYSTRSDSDLAALRFGDEGRGLRQLSRSKGKVSIQTIASDYGLDDAATVAAVGALPSNIKSLRDDFNSSWPLQALFGTIGFKYGIFIVVLLLFGILVGPVNLFVFAKSGQRHRMFFTTPLISLGASLLLVLLIILQDGFGGRGMRFVHMEVRSDASENTAYIQQEQIVRTGVLLSSKHSLPEAGFVTGVPLANSQWARLTTDSDSRGGRYSLEQEGTGLKASGDWYQSRSEHGYLLKGLRPTRGRIELEAASSPPKITSSFDFPISVLVFRDGDGACWRAENLTQGKPTTCASIAEKVYDELVKSSTDQASKTSSSSVKQLALRRSHYLAQSESAPALESYEGINWIKTLTVITGPIQAP